jgi:hypothetical protein
MIATDETTAVVKIRAMVADSILDKYPLQILPPTIANHLTRIKGLYVKMLSKIQRGTEAIIVTKLVVFEKY